MPLVKTSNKFSQRLILTGEVWFEKRASFGSLLEEVVAICVVFVEVFVVAVVLIVVVVVEEVVLVLVGMVLDVVTGVDLLVVGVVVVVIVATLVNGFVFLEPCGLVLNA